MPRPRNRPAEVIKEFGEVEATIYKLLPSLQKLERDLNNISKHRYDYATSQLIWLHLRKMPLYLDSLKELEKKSTKYTQNVLDGEMNDLALMFRMSEILNPEVIELPKKIYFYRKSPVIINHKKSVKLKGLQESLRLAAFNIFSKRFSGDFIEVIVPRDISLKELMHFFNSQGFKENMKAKTKMDIKNMLFGVLANSSAGLPSSFDKIKVLNEWRFRIFGKMTYIHDPTKADSTLRNQISESSRKFLSLAKKATSKLY